MEPNERPVLYYLVKTGKSTAIEAATDVQMSERYDRGVRWHGVPFKTRAEAEAALEILNSN